MEKGKEKIMVKKDRVGESEERGNNKNWGEGDRNIEKGGVG